MLNTSIIMGRLTADPELRHTQNGISVVSITLAVERSYKTGEDRQADFIDVVAWRNTADFVCKYFGKGQMMIVQGSIQTRTYEDRDGNKRKAVEIVAGNVFFGEPKRSESQTSAPSAPPEPDVDVPFPPDPSAPLPGTKEFKEARQMNLDDKFEDLGPTPDEDLPF